MDNVAAFQKHKLKKGMLKQTKKLYKKKKAFEYLSRR